MKRQSIQFTTLLLILLPSFYASAQFSMYDPDIQSFTLRGDSFYVETELINIVKHRKIKSDDTRIYTWAAGGQIQSNQGGYTGRLLHGEYTSINNDHTMREQGSYWYGLKDGNWKYWYMNGRMHRTMTWHRGILKGDFADFDEEGNVIRYGEYRKDRIEGRVYYYEKGAPSKIEYYHRGVILRYQDLTKLDKSKHPVVDGLKKLFKKKTEIETKNDSKENHKK